MHTSTQEASLFCLVLCKKRKKEKNIAEKIKIKPVEGSSTNVCVCVQNLKKQAEAVVRISTLPFTS